MTEATARHHINLFWPAEDGCRVADVPDLRLCSAFGDSPEAAVREVQVAVQAWLASAREHGARSRSPATARPSTRRGQWHDGGRLRRDVSLLARQSIPAPNRLYTVSWVNWVSNPT